MFVVLKQSVMYWAAWSGWTNVRTDNLGLIDERAPALELIHAVTLVLGCSVQKDGRLTANERSDHLGLLDTQSRKDACTYSRYVYFGLAQSETL